MVRETLSSVRRERPLREPGDARQDLIGGLRPHERLGGDVVLVEKLPNRLIERRRRYDGTPRRSCLVVSSANQRSTRFSQEL